MNSPLTPMENTDTSKANEKMELSNCCQKTVNKCSPNIRQCQNVLEIDKELHEALEDAHPKCDGYCRKLEDGTYEHSKLCKIQYKITISRGSDGKVVILNPHHSAIDND